MRIKMPLGLFLSSMFVFGFAVSAFASTLTPEVEMQRERLRELMQVTAIVPSGMERSNVPSINAIKPPEGDRNYFFIGLDSEPTQGCIDFILSFTGIPSELAIIERGEFTLNFLRYEDVESAIIESRQAIEPVNSWVWNMGQVISIEGVGMMTMGHPRNNSLTSFATSAHVTGIEQRRVTANSLTIGSVSRSFVNGNGDVALVNLHDRNFVNSNVQGGPINNFAARASRNDTVISIRGISGTQSSIVDSAVFDLRHPYNNILMRNMITTTSPARDGDSGAALIRRMSATDRAVLGTLVGTYTAPSGRQFAVYTPVVHY